jgi:peptidoglycan-associated lipoprotein
MVPVAALAALVLLGTGCPTSFPDCDRDEQCEAYNLDPSSDGFQAARTHCVDGVCRECSGDGHCERGQECRNNACVAIPNYCDGSTRCPQGQYCVGNRCQAGCDDNYPCPDGYICQNNACIEGCTLDSDCPRGQVCQNRICVDAPVCYDRQFQTVYFDFDDDRIRVDQESRLDHNADCLRAFEDDITIEGHCDERGTNAYNMALGERRARSSKRYLERAGIAGGRMDIISYGEERPVALGHNESAWRQNRRTEFVWR